MSTQWRQSINAFKIQTQKPRHTFIQPNSVSSLQLLKSFKTNITYLERVLHLRLNYEKARYRTTNKPLNQWKIKNFFRPNQEYYHLSPVSTLTNPSLQQSHHHLAGRDYPPPPKKSPDPVIPEAINTTISQIPQTKSENPSGEKISGKEFKTATTSFGTELKGRTIIN